MTGNQAVRFGYDPFDYRLSKTGSGTDAAYLLEGEHMETVLGSHQPATFLRGVVIDEVVNGYQYDKTGQWTNYTYFHDPLQSVSALAGHDGSLLQTMRYGPFGEEFAGTGASCTVLRYTGRAAGQRNRPLLLPRLLLRSRPRPLSHRRPHRLRRRHQLLCLCQ